MIYFIIFALISIISSGLVWQLCIKNLRLPLAVYTGSYFLTTAIGATWIGLSPEGFAWNLMNSYGINTNLIKDHFDFYYWFLLYAPLFIPALVAALVTHYSTPKKFHHHFYDVVKNINLKLVYIITVLIFTAYCSLCLYQYQTLEKLTHFSSIDPDQYQASIKLRSDMMKNLGIFFYGILYTILPTLSQFALYNWLTQKSRSWFLMFACTVLITCTLILLTIQKAPVIVYFIFLAIAYFSLRPIKLKIILSTSIALFGFITLYQDFFTLGWHLTDSFNLLLFRLAICFPFYNAIYPALLPNNGITGLFMMSPPPADNLIVFSLMYPSLKWVEGSSTTAAHMIGYSEFGLLYALLILCLIGLAIGIMAKLRQSITSPLSFAYYMQGLVSLYYLTQTSFRNTLISSYGFIWAIVGLGTLMILITLFKNKFVTINHKLSSSI